MLGALDTSGRLVAWLGGRLVICLVLRPVQFSADVDNHYDMKQRSLFIAPLVVIYCRELALHHRPQGAT